MKSELLCVLLSSSGFHECFQPIGHRPRMDLAITLVCGQHGSRFKKKV